MTVSATVQIAGVKEAVRSLNKIEPGLRKQFTAELTQIAAPAIQEAQHDYDRTGVPLSGMVRAWAKGWRTRGGFSTIKARGNVKVVLLNDRRRLATILIQQSNGPAAIFESAGRRSANKLSKSLDSVASERGFRTIRAGRTRLLGPAVYRQRRAIEGEMGKAAIAVINRAQRELN